MEKSNSATTPPLSFLEERLRSFNRQHQKAANLNDLLTACTLIPVKLTLNASGEVTYEANHFKERLHVMCSTYRAELAAFLSRLPDGCWDSMKRTPEGEPLKKR